MKRAIRCIASVLAAGVTFAISVPAAFAGPEHVDPGIDFHLDPKDPLNKVIIHQGAEFTITNFERTFRVNRFDIRRLNPDYTIPACAVLGKMKIVEGIYGMEMRKSEAIWENCPVENRYIYIVPGSVIRLRGDVSQATEIPKASEPDADVSTETNKGPIIDLDQEAPAPTPVPAVTVPETGAAPAAPRPEEASPRTDQPQSVTERISDLESKQFWFTVAFSVMVALLTLFGVMWWRAVRALSRMAFRTSKEFSATIDLAKLDELHRVLNAKYSQACLDRDDFKIERDTAVAANRTITSDRDTARREAGTAQSANRRLQQEELPQARAAIPPAVEAMHRHVDVSLTHIYQALAGPGYDPAQDEGRTIDERATRLRIFAQSWSGMLTDATFRLHDTLHLEPPDPSHDLHDSLLQTAEAARRIYQAAESNLTTLLDLTGQSGSMEVPVDVRPYQELQAENAELRRRLEEFLSQAEGVQLEEVVESTPIDAGSPESPERDNPSEAPPSAVTALALEPVNPIPGADDTHHEEDATQPRLGQTVLISDYAALTGATNDTADAQESAAQEEIHAVPLAGSIDREAIEIQGPRTKRYLTEQPPSIRNVTGMTTQGMQAVTLERLNPDERSRFFGAIEWLISHHGLDQPFIITSQLELSTLQLLMKTHIIVREKLMHLGELVERERYESLQSGEWPRSGDDPDVTVPESREELFRAFHQAMRQINSSHPYYVASFGELGLLHELCQIGIVHEGGEMRLADLFDSTKEAVMGS